MIFLGPILNLHLLSGLKTMSGERINIIQQIAPSWKEFCTNLEFDPNGVTIQTIERKYRYDPETCCREMMQLWLNGRGRQPATLKQLIKILRDCNLRDPAQQVEEAIPYN